MKKRVIALVLVLALVLCSCSKKTEEEKPSGNITAGVSEEVKTNSGNTDGNDKQEGAQNNTTQTNQEETSIKSVSAHLSNDPFGGLTSSEYASTLSFDGLEDEKLLRYVEDSVYTELVGKINSDEYFIQNVEAVYISKEYVEELTYNSQSNVFFGYTLADLEAQFQGQKYVFTLAEDGSTVAVPFEEYDDTFEQVIKNVAIGTGVILVCVVVSVATAGAGAAAASMIFAASAKTAATMAVSSSVISGVSAGVVKGIETGNMEEALKAGALAGSEGFKWGAISGAVSGGVTEAVALKGATVKGLTMNEAAIIQKESKYPLDVIKEFSSMEQYNICKDAGLTTQMLDGKTMLIRKIDLDYVDDIGRSNLQRMKSGLAALDPSTGTSYELHHIGQQADSTLAILTKAEHMQGGNDLIWHNKAIETAVHGEGNNWDAERKAIWKAVAALLEG
ncbi:MAG: HNH/ENDO VII family nuclease [Lachnospiraceae bacterium]|nr:HNH/ENDO VII family nuclease [Lachnospiraceae bacterium]